MVFDAGERGGESITAWSRSAIVFSRNPGLDWLRTKE